MSITIGKKQFRLTQIGLTAFVLIGFSMWRIVYYASLSLWDMAFPVAFLWLMWTLNGIKAAMREVEELQKKLEQIEAR